MSRCGSFVLNDSLTKVDANVAFNGISDIVSSHGKDKPFNIVEVVPDKKMASIGYLIDGQEPDDWFGTLAQMSDKEGAGVQKRADYMSGLKTKLAPITTEKKDNTKPLYYEPYEESYVNQGNDWSELALVDMDKINQGTEGYKMTKQEKGDYKFNTDYQLAVNEEDCLQVITDKMLTIMFSCRERMRQKMALNLWIQEKEATTVLHLLQSNCRMA